MFDWLEAAFGELHRVVARRAGPDAALDDTPDEAAHRTEIGWPVFQTTA
jgi:hypothetical protein